MRAMPREVLILTTAAACFSTSALKSGNWRALTWAAVAVFAMALAGTTPAASAEAMAMDRARDNGMVNLLIDRTTVDRETVQRLVETVRSMRDCRMKFHADTNRYNRAMRPTPRGRRAAWRVVGE